MRSDRRSRPAPAPCSRPRICRRKSIDGTRAGGDSEAVARRIARLAKAAAKQQAARQQSAPSPAPAAAPAPVACFFGAGATTTWPGLQAFCRGAGIGPETLPVDAHARMLHLAGQLLRESLLGLKATSRSQQEQRGQLRVTYEKPRADIAAVTRTQQRRGADPGIAQGARQPPLRRGGLAARRPSPAHASMMTR